MATPNNQSRYINYKVKYWLPVSQMSAQLIATYGGVFRRVNRTHYCIIEHMTAQHKIDIIRDVRMRGGTLISIAEQEPANFLQRMISKEYRKQFLVSLRFNVESGMSAGKALDMVILNEMQPKYRVQLNPGLMVLRRGGSFSEAMEQIALYGRSTLAVLKAGERTGRMLDALNAALTQFQRGQMLMVQLKAMFLLLSFDLFSVVSGLYGARQQILPMFAKSLDSQPAEKVEALKFKIQFARLCMDSFLGFSIILGVIAVSLGLIYYSTKRQVIKEKIEGLFYRIPLFSKFFLSNAIAESMAITASMLRGGVGLMEAITISQASTVFPSVSRYWEMVTKRLNAGESPSIALAISPLDFAEQSMIRNHSSTNHLAECMESISSRRTEASVQAASKIKTSALYGSLIYMVIPILVMMWVLAGMYSSITGALSGGG